MDISSDRKVIRASIAEARRSGKRIAFVPTMGNLHDGHISLIDRANQTADFVICSIFVNPMQFGANEDLDRYPRTLKEDVSKLQQANCDLLYTPETTMLYPNGQADHTHVVVPNLTRYHCGESRPTHFGGVATIVTMLFNIVMPDYAIFGEKDFQQLAVIKKLTRDLCFPIEVLGHPTRRESDGLAMSSRNSFLSDVDRAVAPMLFHVLRDTAEKLKQNRNETYIAEITELAIQQLSEAGFKVDYFNIADAQSLEPAAEASEEVVILAAVFLGETRLIDNVVISEFDN